MLAAPALATDSKGEMEEIVVTATRHEESLSKVPLSVTALSQDALDSKGIKDFTDVVRFTPGVTIDTSGTNAISIRGISSSGGAGTTGIYIDDTPIQMRALGFNPDETLPKTFDLDRVEVLRGPQGTLFGAGSEGGTVRYIMTQPSLTKESTYARTELSTTQGGDPNLEGGIAHGGPIIDGVLGYRASIWYRYDGGYIDRVDHLDANDPTALTVVDHKTNHSNSIAGRLAFILQPVEGVTITPALMVQNVRRHDQSTYWPAYSSGSHLVNGSPERYPVPDEYYLPSLKIEADVGTARLVSNTSYYHRSEQTAYLGTVYDLAYFQSQVWNIGSCGSASTSAFSPTSGCSWYPLIDANGIHPLVDATTGLPLFPGYSTPNKITNRQDTVTQEIRLQSNDDSSRWKWTVGAFWSLSKELSIEELRDTQVIPVWNALFGIDPRSYPFFQDASGNGNWYYCNGVGTPGLGFPDCDIYYNHNLSHDRQLAAFGEATYSVTERVKLTAGGRYAKMSFDLNHTANGLENSGPGQNTGRYAENAFTPKLGVSFQVDPNDLYYLTYSKGFRPGGVNPPLPLALCGPTPAGFKSDSTQSYEVGAKNNFGGKLRLASSVYFIKWNQIQQNVYVPGACGFQYTDNTGTAIAKGFDVQAEAVVGGGVSVDLSVGYTNARYSKSSPLAQAGDAISGEAAINYAPGVNPPWNVAVGTQYNFTALRRDGFVRLDWEYASRNPWRAAVQDPANAHQFDPNSYTLPATSFASLRAGVILGPWSVTAFVDNLFDSHTVLNYALVQSDISNPSYSANSPPLPTSVQQNQFGYRPRTIGITASYRL